MKGAAIGYLLVTVFVMIAFRECAYFYRRATEPSAAERRAKVRGVVDIPSPTPSPPPVKARPSPSATPYKKMTYTIDPDPEADGLSADEMERLRQLLEEKGYGDYPSSGTRRNRRGYERSEREHRSY